MTSCLRLESELRITIVSLLDPSSKRVVFLSSTNRMSETLTLRVTLEVGMGGSSSDPVTEPTCEQPARSGREPRVEARRRGKNRHGNWYLPDDQSKGLLLALMR